ncbi:MAG TPA: hypothetical protein VHR45_07660 [Thermoanaerobaculia bacterium]|nr:hypothetical protein [Thermoanaerobaculia bacterium]
MRLGWFAAVALAAYAAAVIAVSLHHELWQDEVRTWSIAREARSLSELFANVRNDGHPALWYVVLFAGTRLTSSRAVLPVSSLLVAVAAIACLLLCAPFKWWLKLLFLCGVLPLYEYSVMARNNGLVMLTLFAACAIYPRRLDRPLPLAAALALLANSSVHGAIVAAGFALAIATEWALGGRRRTAGSSSSIAAVLVLAAGFAAAFIHAWPDESSTIFHPERLSVPAVSHALGLFVRHPAHPFPRVFWGTGWPLLGAAMIWLFALALLDMPYLLGIFLFGTVGLALFLDLVYRSPLRHQGVLILLMVAMTWMMPAARTIPLWRPLQTLAASLRRFAVPAALAVLFLTHAVYAYRVIRFDLQHDMTSAKAFGELLRRQPFRNAVIMGEPDSAMESLPFYAPNRIYIPRERRFGTWTHFTSDSRRNLSLGNLLFIGKALREETRQPVLLALGHDLSAQPSISFGYGSIFTWSPAQRAQLQQETTLVATFQSAATERYEVFSFR